MGQGAAQDLYGIQHGDTSDWYKPQWSLWDAFNPLGGATSAEQLSQNIANFESSVLASDRDALPEAQAGWKTGWSGLGIPDDIQIEYGGSRSDPEIENLINKARERVQQERIAYGDDWTGNGGPPVPKITQKESQMEFLDPTAQQQEAAQEALDEMEGGENYGDFNTGGPVIKRRGFGEAATSPLAAGSFVDKPLYDRAVDTSPTYRRW
jgi:hypothetical protein